MTERDEALTENARLKSEVESLRKAEGTMCAEIDLCHAGLEKARVALQIAWDTMPYSSNTIRDALATINALLQNWNIHVEYPPGTPDDQKFYKKG